MELDVLREQPQVTEVGSYFVSNYPPYSVWSADHISAALGTLETPPVDDRPMGLYLHIPFCRKRCKFCYFRVYTDKNAADVDAYMDALAREIELYKDRPRLAGRQFEFVYFGGGTPSFLSSEQLLRLVEQINRHWRWDAAREVTFECEPGTLKPGKLETIRKIGVTRLSLGIEHWDDAVLEENGRAHRSKEIALAYEWARQAGFPQINVDLIAGMVGDSEDGWKRAVEKTLAVQPDSVTIYQLELPHNAVFSREAKSGQAVAAADWPTKRRWVAYAFDVFEKAGYRVSSGYTLFKPGPRAGFVYRDALWHGGDMVGTGVASFSHVGGVHFQNVDQWDEYLARLSRGELPINRALRLTDRQRLIRELILQLKLGEIDLEYFRAKFGVDLRSELAEPLASLVTDGHGNFVDDRFTLTRAGLLRVDGLLPRFFEPEFRGIRYT